MKKENKKILKISQDDIFNHQQGLISFKDLSKKYNIKQSKLHRYFKKNNILRRNCFVKDTIKHNFFDIIDTQEKAYILGLYLADGSINNNRFTIGLTEQDLELIIQIKNIISPASNVNFTRTKINKQGIKSNPMCKLSITSNNITNTLSNLGFGKQKTYLLKSIENVVPTNMMNHFIRGYFDGDGCITYTEAIKNHITKFGEHKKYISKNYSYNIISKDPKLLTEIKNYLSKIVKVNTHESKGCLVISINRYKDIIKIYNLMYADSLIFLKRKKLKFEKILGIPC